MVVLVVVAALAALVFASLGLAHVLPTWAILFFYVVPGLFFAGWTLIELHPRGWRRLATRLRRRWRQSALTGDPATASPPARTGGQSVWEPSGPWLFAASLAWFMRSMQRVLRAWRQPMMARAMNVGFGAATIAIALLAARAAAGSGWSLPHVGATRVAAAGAFFLSAAALKSVGWQRLFRPAERPRSLELAAATGAAGVAGLALPGRFDDAIRLAVLRRIVPRPPGAGTLVLSLFLLGLLDAAALAPLAATAAVSVGASATLRVAMIVVAFAGSIAGALALSLPWARRSEHVCRFRAGHWVASHAPDSRREIGWAFVLVSLSWLARVSGIFVLLGALAGDQSFALACAFLSAGAASAALPVAPAGAVTQAGVGAAVLSATGVDARAAVAVAVVTQALGVLAGVAVVLLAGGLRGARSLTARM